MRLVKESYSEAKKFVLRATEMESDHADGWNLLAWAYAHEARYGLSQSRKKSLEQALRALNRAIKLNPSNSGYHVTL